PACCFSPFWHCCQSSSNRLTKKNSSLTTNGLKKGLKLTRLKAAFLLKTTFRLKNAFDVEFAPSTLSAFTTFSIFPVLLLRLSCHPLPHSHRLRTSVRSRPIMWREWSKISRVSFRTLPFSQP